MLSEFSGFFLIYKCFKVLISSCVKSIKYKKFIPGKMFIDFFKSNILIIIIKSTWGKSILKSKSMYLLCVSNLDLCLL